MAKSRTWSVTTTGERPLADISRDLARLGFRQAELLEELGIITGSVEDSQISRMRSVPGVAEITPEGESSVGPPGSPDTW